MNVNHNFHTILNSVRYGFSGGNRVKHAQQISLLTQLGIDHCQTRDDFKKGKED
jgi:hypothetical protein